MQYSSGASIVECMLAHNRMRVTGIHFVHATSYLLYTVLHSCAVCNPHVKLVFCRYNSNAAVSTVPIEEYPTWYTAFPYQGMVIPGEKVNTYY
jgi:hypothetical protein